MKSKIFTLIVIGIVLLAGCKDKVNTTKNYYCQLKVVPLFNGQEMELNVPYTGADGNAFKFERIAFFTTNLSVNNYGLMKEASLFNMGKNEYLFNTKSLVNEVKTLDFHTGVTSQFNHTDPTIFGNNHALNIANVDGLHWGWDPGYIFIAIEGKADTIADGQDNFDHSFVYHVGKDGNGRLHQFENVETVALNDTTHCAYLYLDMHTFFFGATDTIHVNSENSIHEGGQFEALAQKTVENFNSALTK
ncbi:hypothetical protein SAMN05216474_2229 [Lishizhenia tianjinensis]|uniref:Copper-binding protein MbnP-like domain-containing protein n=1 Tax=Lishizhenia tianjinensis TaxID=477690 RepID=A0A1I7AMA8_9FLAO|nr:MbnP family protein [Lishizhenia tianjinensis]SFT76101.1 hypothetical protein SAMN05216474_2229 [Lishizhenia tianjinensis]